MFIVAYDTDGDNTAPRSISKADGKRWLLLHVPVAPPSSSAQEKRRYLVVQNPIIIYDIASIHTAAAVTYLLRRWQWEILEHPP